MNSALPNPDHSSQVLGYQNRAEHRSMRFNILISRLKIAALSLVAAIAFIAGLIGVYNWYDWHCDHIAREWIDGPHTDLITFIRLTGGTPTGSMEVTISDPSVLKPVNQLLQNPSAQSGDIIGHSIDLEVTLHSGRIVRTWGSVSDHTLTWMPPDGDWWGSWDTLTIRFDNHTPPALLAALKFADQSTGSKHF